MVAVLACACHAHAVTVVCLVNNVCSLSPGTAAAPAVFNKYKKADVTKYKVPPKPKPKGLRDGGNRYGV